MGQQKLNVVSPYVKHTQASSHLVVAEKMTDKPAFLIPCSIFGYNEEIPGNQNDNEAVHYLLIKQIQC